MTAPALQTQFFAATQESRWLLIALHGLGDSVDGYVWLPPTLRIPWLNYLLVNAPDAYYGGYSWYDFARDPGPGIERSRRLLFQLLDLQREAGFAAAQTFIFGFSQGCLMTLELGFRAPQKFAGLIGVSGYAHEPHRLVIEMSPAAREQQFLITHGTDDTLIPIAPVREQIRIFQSVGMSMTWREFAKGHTITNEELALIREFIIARGPGR